MNRTDFALVRLDRDGALDATFGSSATGQGADRPRGQRRHRLRRGRAGRRQDRRRGQRAGRRASGQDFASRATTADGTLDAGFGTGGKVTTAFSADSDTAYAMVVQADGKIVVGGDSYQGAERHRRRLRARPLQHRRNARRQLRQSSTAGKVITGAGGSQRPRSIYALALQTVAGEARIVAAGGEGDFSVARYLPNGTLDAAFGAGRQRQGHGAHGLDNRRRARRARSPPTTRS